MPRFRVTLEKSYSQDFEVIADNEEEAVKKAYAREEEEDKTSDMEFLYWCDEPLHVERIEE